MADITTSKAIDNTATTTVVMQVPFDTILAIKDSIQTVTQMQEAETRFFEAVLKIIEVKVEFGRAEGSETNKTDFEKAATAKSPILPHSLDRERVMLEKSDISGEWSSEEFLDGNTTATATVKMQVPFDTILAIKDSTQTITQMQEVEAEFFKAVRIMTEVKVKFGKAGRSEVDGKADFAQVETTDKPVDRSLEVAMAEDRILRRHLNREAVMLEKSGDFGEWFSKEERVVGDALGMVDEN